jgi:hypothetical protein
MPWLSKLLGSLIAVHAARKAKACLSEPVQANGAGDRCSTIHCDHVHPLPGPLDGLRRFSVRLTRRFRASPDASPNKADRVNDTLRCVARDDLNVVQLARCQSRLSQACATDDKAHTGDICGREQTAISYVFALKIPSQEPCWPCQLRHTPPRHRLLSSTTTSASTICIDTLTVRAV